MSILTNGEIYTAYIEAANQTLRPQDERIALAFARAVEKAVIAKLAAEVGVEPLYYTTITADARTIHNPYYTIEQLQTAIAAARVQALEEAARISEKHFHSTTAKQIRALIGKAST